MSKERLLDFADRAKFARKRMQRYDNFTKYQNISREKFKINVFLTQQSKKRREKEQGTHYYILHAHTREGRKRNDWADTGSARRRLSRRIRNRGRRDKRGKGGEPGREQAHSHAAIPDCYNSAGGAGNFNAPVGRKRHLWHNGPRTRKYRPTRGVSQSFVSQCVKSPITLHLSLFISETYMFHPAKAKLSGGERRSFATRNIYVWE